MRYGDLVLWVKEVDRHGRQRRTKSGCSSVVTGSAKDIAPAVGIEEAATFQEGSQRMENVMVRSTMAESESVLFYDPLVKESGICPTTGFLERQSAIFLVCSTVTESEEHNGGRRRRSVPRREGHSGDRDRPDAMWREGSDNRPSRSRLIHGDPVEPSYRGQERGLVSIGGLSLQVSACRLAKNHLSDGDHYHHPTH
jgi:hypothetical protein